MATKSSRFSSPAARLLSPARTCVATSVVDSIQNEGFDPIPFIPRENEQPEVIILHNRCRAAPASNSVNAAPILTSPTPALRCSRDRIASKFSATVKTISSLFSPSPRPITSNPPSVSKTELIVDPLPLNVSSIQSQSCLVSEQRCVAVPSKVLNCEAASNNGEEVDVQLWKELADLLWVNSTLFEIVVVALRSCRSLPQTVLGFELKLILARLEEGMMATKGFLKSWFTNVYPVLRNLSNRVLPLLMALYEQTFPFLVLVEACSERFEEAREMWTVSLTLLLRGRRLATFEIFKTEKPVFRFVKKFSSILRRSALPLQNLKILTAEASGLDVSIEGVDRTTVKIIQTLVPCGVTSFRFGVSISFDED
ncbi:hypothetical protein BT69DRAFT_1331638 [Atractiella rhizophila]|nr:hypothetical protein BT69DRAFT_1331638 [Atractiella rhizophila]